MDINIKEIVDNYDFQGALESCIPYGNGHINDTYLLTFEKDSKSIKVVLQRINKTVFTKPVEVMENIIGITSYLRKQIIKQGGDPERETLNVIPAVDGRYYYEDPKGEYWRFYNYIVNATSYEQVERPEDFYESAVAFGNFQYLLADYPASTLYETIPSFHDTKARFQRFKEVVVNDVCGRVKTARPEIDFVLKRQQVAEVFGELLEKGEIPLRVTHNDTKLNNVLIDNDTRKGICIIDLDTVMPGLAMNDFGDSIRFGASTGVEDEQDLSKIWCDLDLFKLYAKGFIKGSNGRLTEKEIALLPMGAKVMTFECGMRFLTDYLEGDQYFKIQREGHNLDRSRTQFKLVADMENKWDEMHSIIKSIANTC